jgi:threonine aldolase
MRDFERDCFTVSRGAGVIIAGMFKGIDLYSDTVTRPSDAMRKAMVDAVVGDEQKGEDPTTLELEQLVARTVGKSAGLFLPSATMANEIAIRHHCRPGDELVAEARCHLFVAETGGPAVHAGVFPRPITTTTGVFSDEEVRAAATYAVGPNHTTPRLLSVENTTNLTGGYAWTKAQLDSVLKTADQMGMKTHLDGSRLFNAAVQTKEAPAALAARFDTVTVCFSKGLGAPTGAVLAFDDSEFTSIRRLKQLMGGAMRKSGILAAACIYALKHNVDRLAEDHANANVLAKGLADNLPFIRVVNPVPQTNIVLFDWDSPRVGVGTFLEDCQAQGLRFSQIGRKRLRAVTHLDVTRADMDKAVQIVKGICRQYESGRQ